MNGYDCIFKSIHDDVSLYAVFRIGKFTWDRYTLFVLSDGKIKRHVV